MPDTSDFQVELLVTLSAFTFLIHLIGTLAYFVPLTGIRTRRIAVSFALFNVLVTLPAGSPGQGELREHFSL